jgi:hypothetical protein
MSVGALLAYRNDADTATVSLGMGGTLAGFPLSNLALRQLSKVARLNLAGPPRIDVDLGAVQNVKLIALLALGNVQPTAAVDLVVQYSQNGSTWFTATVDIVNDAGVTTLPTGVFLVPVKAGPDGSPTGDGVGVRARYLRLTPNWVPIAGSYRDIGRLWVSDALVIPAGVDGDFELDFIDTGTLDASDGSQFYESKKTRTRALRVNLSAMPAQTAYGFADNASSALDVPSIQGLQMEAGCTSEIIVLPRTTSGLWVRRMGVYGHVDANARPTIRKTAGDSYSTSFTAIEER